MKEFQLEFLSNKKNKRWLTILNFLELSEVISSTDLSKAIGVAERTIILDVNQIKNEISKYSEITSFHTGYTLKIKNMEKYLSFKKELLSQEPLFIILENIFYSNLYSIDEWSDKLYISKTTLVRYLTKVEDIFTKYKLSIQYNPLNFVGSEVNIRKFFVDFYYISNYTPHTVFPDLKVVELAETLFKNEKFQNNTSITSLELAYYIYISIERSLQGHIVSLSKESNKIYINNNNNEFEKLDRYVYMVYNHQLPVDELAYIYYLYISNRTTNQSKELEFCHQFSSYFQIDSLVKKIFNDQRIFSENKQLDFIFLTSFFTSVKIKHLLSSVYLMNITDHTTDSINYNLVAYENLYPYVQLVLKKLKIDIYKEDIVSNFLRLRQTLRDIYVKKQKNIVFLLEGDTFIRQNIKAKATKYFSFHNLFFIDKMYFENFMESNYIDIVVTNYSEYFENISTKKYILFNTIPNINDWESLLIEISSKEDLEFLLKK
ncbi:helix-turn-helix domain-containing protein [Enterococcus mundtii]|uniref:helix-turn-helix domain-containing protein n=1 Tax=Enterococcus mundtii TaxID=53346 RepID=UPI001FB8E054|nr:helix-turn-helix domain-containing protein [Enterococcus mundtii]GKS56148.1 hypothetical protein EMLAB_27630 [Enterococcus mundtii]